MHSLYCKYKNLGVTSTYPGKDNSYKVKITGLDGESYTTDFFPKAEYDLIVNKLQPLLDTLTEDTMDELVRAIEEFGDERYEQASDQAAMDNAGEAL